MVVAAMAVSRLTCPASKIASDAPTDNHFELGGAQGRATYTFDSGYSITNIAAWRAYHDRSRLDTDQLPIDFFNLNDQGRDLRIAQQLID